jgi:type II secretory pathway pseudopilin PulG
LVLLSILSGAAVTSLSGLTSSRQNVAATRIRTALVYAQEWARGSNNDTWVVFDTSSDLVSVFVEDPSNPGKANRLALADPLTRSALTIQLGLDGADIISADLGSTAELQFDSLGIPYDAKGSILTADGTVGVTGGLTIRITKNTGLITID